MTYKMTCLLVLMAIGTTTYGQADEHQEMKFFSTPIAIDNEYPLVVVDHVPYCLFGLPKPGTGRPAFIYRVTAKTKNSLFWIKDVDLQDSKLRFYWYIPSTDGNAPLVNGISVSVSNDAGQHIPTLDPKVNASEFVRRTEKAMMIKDEYEVRYSRYEYCVNNQPTGKFLAFVDVESEVAGIDKSFKPRKMILTGIEEAATFVRVTAFDTSGK